MLVSWGQDRVTASGTVTDKLTGETLIGATVQCADDPSRGAMTNAYGYFVLPDAGGCGALMVRFLGYETYRWELSGQPSEWKGATIALEPLSVITGEAVVAADRGTAMEQAARIGTLELRPEEARAIPQLFGERDVIKAIQLMPGVQATSDGGSGFFVRGGGADQNLILLDEAPVYNPSHLLGFFSVFNGDALHSAELYKSGIPARYGGRASSVLDIRMKDGNAKKVTVQGGVGLISSRLTIEGPLAKGQGAWLISGRRTYADLFLKLSSDEALQRTALYFYDINAKANYRFKNGRHLLFLSFYNGRDDFDFADLFLLRWGNQTATLRWNALISDRIFSNTSVIWSNYSYRIGFGIEDFSFFRDAGIQDGQIKQDFTWYAADQHTIRFGALAIRHRFSDAVSVDPDPLPNRVGLESALYIEDEWELNASWKVLAGLRWSRFDWSSGPIFDLDAGGTVVSQRDGGWGSVPGQGGLEPRLALQGVTGEGNGWKASIERNRQYLHLVSNSAAGNPTDLWMPVSNNIRPLIADQVSVGWTRPWVEAGLTLGMEAYYKSMRDLLEFRVGADVFAPETLESEVVSGDGEAYGLECMLRRQRGKLTGWISYTLSRSFRTFATVDDGNPFPASSDRIHDFSAVAMWEAGPRVSLSANWVYHTGDPATFPTGLYQIDGRLVTQYTARNAGRVPAYHRLDVGLTLRSKKGVARSGSAAWQAFRGGEWTFSVYNAYGRENTYLINFESELVEGNLRNQAVSFALFKAIPSISYDFKF